MEWVIMILALTHVVTKPHSPIFMRVILKDILDAGLVAPIALILMILVDYFNFNSLLLPIQISGMYGISFNQTFKFTPIHGLRGHVR
jgi:hypothetical protein